MKIIATATILIATGAWAQTPRWRYVELPTYNGNTPSPVSISEQGSISTILFRPNSQSSAWRGALYNPGTGYTIAPLATLPDGNQYAYIPWKLNSSGGTVGKMGDQFATWTPGGSVVLGATGAIGDHQFYNASGQGILVTTPRHPLEPRLWGFSTSIGGPVYGIIGSGENTTEVNDFNDQGVAVGKVFSGASLSDQPAVWTNQGQTLSFLTSPGQIAGKAIGIDHSGNVFGLVAKQSPQPGWYGTWWDGGGNVIRQIYFYRLSQSSPVSDPAGNSGGTAFLAADGSVVYNDIDGPFANKIRYYSPMTGIVNVGLSVDGLPVGSRLNGIRGMSDGKRMFGAVSFDATGTSHRNFYLEPVPEPASVGVLTVGLLGILRRKRRAG